MNTSSSVNRKLLSGVVGGLTFTAVGVIVSLLQFSILIRRLPLIVVGIWMIFTNLGSYVLFLDLGLSPTLGREISFAAGDPSLTDAERAVRIHTLVRSCTGIVSLLALFIMLVGSVGGWIYLRTIVPVALASTARAAWFVYIAGAALNLVGEGWFAGIYGLGHVFAEKMVRVSGSLCGLLFMTIAVYFGGGFRALAMAYVLQSLCFLIMARIVFSHLTAHAVAKGYFDRKLLGRLIAPSLKYAATMLGGILILQTDNVVIASTLGPSSVPDYQAVAKIVTILMSLSMMLVTTSSPLISQAHARHDVPAAIRLLSRNLRFSLGVMVVLGSFLACFADRVIGAWLGPGHFVGFPIVWVLLAVMMLEAHHQALGSAVMATGRIVFLLPALLAGVLNIVFSIVLAHRFGLIGVVVGTMAAQIITNNWYVPWYAMRLFDIPLRSHIRMVLFPVAAGLGTMLIVNYSARCLTSHLSNVASVCLGGVFMLVAGPACFSMMLDAEERLLLRAKLRSLILKQPAILTATSPK